MPQQAVERLQGWAIISIWILSLDFILNAAKIHQKQETTKENTSINKRLTLKCVGIPEKVVSLQQTFVRLERAPTSSLSEGSMRSCPSSQMLLWQLDIGRDWADWEVTKLFHKPKVERRSYHRTPRLPFVGAGAVAPNLSLMQLVLFSQPNSDQYPTAIDTQNVGDLIILTTRLRWKAFPLLCLCLLQRYNFLRNPNTLKC